MDVDQRLRKRLQELADLSEQTNCFYFTDFLSPADISVAYEVSSQNALTIWGGIDGAERAMVRFGSAKDFGYEVAFPIETLCIRPKNQKFAQQLTHRDYLGSLMSLGVERDVIGDILLTGNKNKNNEESDNTTKQKKDEAAYVFVAERMVDYIIDTLSRIKHTDVICEKVAELPPGIGYTLERKKLTAASNRLDMIVAKLYHVSRNEAKEKFAKQEVFLNGRICTNPSIEPKPDDSISVRHKGKSIYRGISHETRKGNIVIELDVYV